MIHHIFANKSNIGDWLSALGIQSVLASIEVTEHFCDESFVDETLEDLSMTTQNDLIIIGGGGLFMDYFTPPRARREPMATAWTTHRIILT